MDSKCPLLPGDPILLDNILVPDLYMKIGCDFPSRIFARILTENGDEQSLEDITWGRLLHDSTIAATSLLGFGVPKREGNVPQIVLAILANSSYRYYTYLVGAWLNGWTPLLLSTRNSLPAIQHLMSSVGARCILMDDSTSNLEPDLRRLTPDAAVMKLQDTPSELRNAHQEKTRSRGPQTSLDEVAIYMHTSGSQGHPKAVPTTHRQFVTGIKARSAKNYAGSSVYAPLPLFHGMGIYAFTRWPIGSGVVPTFVAMQRPLSGVDVARHLRYLPQAIAFLAPAILEDIVDAGNSEIMSLTNAQHIFYGGAPLKECAGNILVSKGVSISNAFGMSEISLISVLEHPSEDLLSDWSYVRFREDMYTLYLLPIGPSAVCELVVGPGVMCPSVLNHELGFATHDLWAPHPKIQGLWKHMGRKDGVTVLSTGEKTDNGQLVSLLTQDLRIAHVAPFGSGKPLSGVIISPSLQGQAVSASTDGFEPDAFLERIWDTIEQVNSVVPKHSRLIRQMVLIEDPSRRFVVSDKGTVRLKETLVLYEQEISAAYSSFRAENDPPLNREAVLNPVQLRTAIRDIVNKVCGKPVGDDCDIFDSGADSLHVLQIRAALLPLFKGVARDLVPHNFVYTHPTIDQMVTFILSCIGKTGLRRPPNDNKKTRVESCLRRFSNLLPPRAPKTYEGIVILLTGSTGSLGGHVLDYLLSLPNIKRIHCLVRGEASIRRLQAVFSGKSLPINRLVMHQNKISIHTADFSKSDLCLNLETLELLRREVTHIFHLAWELNFNWPLERFEKTHITCTRHLIDIACSSTRLTPPKLIFSSSISAVGNYMASNDVPEQAFPDPTVCMDTGYGESKYVAEQLIDSASRKLGFSATIIRCGQLSGSKTNGAWARTEFIPILFKSSLSLGLFPEVMPPVRWLPVDIAAQCFSDLAFGDTNGLTYYHVENTESTSWSDITKMFLAVAGSAVKVVPTQEWLAAMEMAGKTPDNALASVAPAAFLLDFYSRLTAASGTWRTLDTSVASHLAPGMRYAKITPELLNKYVRWVAEGTTIRP